MAQRFKGRVNVGQLGVAGSTVTGAAGAATLNASSGTITTESLSTAAGATFTETLTNSFVAAADLVFATVSTAGTGSPVMCEITPAAGSVVITIMNNHASAAFNAALVIKFLIVKQ